jgi:hypothetical protein
LSAPVAPELAAQPATPALSGESTYVSTQAQRPVPAVSRGSSLKTIRRLDLGSVFRVTFVISALLFALFGCIGIVLPSLFGASLLGALGGRDYGPTAAGGTFLAVLLTYVLLVVIGSIVEGIVTVIAAFVYNLAAGWVGGIQVELRE